MATLKDRLRDILDNRIRATARRVMNTPLPQSLQAPTRTLNQATRAVEKHPWIGAPVRMVKGRGGEQAKLLTSSAQDFSQGKPVQGALKAVGFGLSLTPPGAGSAALMGGLSALGAPSGDRARAFGRSTTYASIFGKGSQITNPFINKAITGMGLGQKTGFVASRAVPALANVAQGIGLDRTAGTPTTPTSIGIDLAAGLVGGRGSFASSGAIRGAKAVKPRLTMKGNDPGELTQMYNAIRKMDLDEMVSDRLGMVKNFNDTASHYLKKLGFKATQISKMTETEKWRILSPHVQENVMYRVGDVPVMGISSPKDTRTSQSLLGESGDTSKSNKLQLDETATRTSATEVTSLKPIIPKKGKKKGKLNLENLAVDEIGKRALREVNEDLPVSVISNKSVVDRARTAKGTKALTDEKMRDIIAQQLKNRQKVVDLAAQFSNAKKNGASEEELAKIMLEISEQSRVAQQGGTFAGRLLQAQNIMADRSATPMQKVLALLDNAGVKEEKYLKDAVKVNWEDPVEVVKFYRKYVPPSLGEVLTEVRYTNMLSSPMTHIVNIASNALQTAVVAPVEKTISGTLDWAKSVLTKSERQYYANAGIEYAKGYVKALPRAIKKAIDILSQKEISVKPDLEYVPTGVGGPLSTYTTPLRGLEAMDQFFKTLVEGGVTRELRASPKKLSAIKIAKMASQEAEYRLFRQKFDPTGELGQGYVLQLFDLWNSAILNLRRLPGGKWILPFMQTPTNILKQGLEYSPLGVVTIPGSKNATEQLSKSIIGSGVFLAAYQLAKSGLTTWSAPTGEKERELYYAAGLQPYSVKIGDKWVSYSKLGPLSYPIAMAAALANVERTKPDQETKNNIAESIGGILAFFGDQSYVKNIGDLVDAIQGGVSVGSTAISSQAANLAGQLVTYRSFLTWLGRITDPTYRKAKTFKERMVKDIPIIGSDLEPYRDPFGNPSMRDLPLVNAFFPARISVEKQPAESEYRLYEKGRIQRGVEKRSGEKLIQEGGSNQVSADKYQYLDDEGSVKTINIGKVLSMPENNAINRAKKDKEVWKTADDILNSNLAPNLQAQALQKLGVDIEQAEYYNIAKETNDLKYLYIEEEINKIISTTKNREDVLKFLVKQRQEVGGKVILSSGVIDDLRKAGYISKAEADKLKNITFDGKTTTPQVSVSGRGGGATLKSIKLTAPKMGSIRGKIPSLAQTKITPPSAKDPFGIKQFNPQDVVRQFSKQVQASQEAVARIRPISRSSFNI